MLTNIVSISSILMKYIVNVIVVMFLMSMPACENSKNKQSISNQKILKINQEKKSAEPLLTNNKKLELLRQKKISMKKIHNIGCNLWDLVKCR